MNIDALIRNYNESERAKIIFDGNGKGGPELEDKNLEYRRKLIDYFYEKKSTFPLDLIADLYVAEAQFAYYAWGASPSISALAQELLERGREQYIDAYMKGLGCGMDAFLMARRVNYQKNA